MKTIMKKKRLLKLANYLLTIPPALLDMESWITTKGYLTAPTTKKGLIKCGYAACACGWATTIPEFRKLGLHLGRNGSPGVSSCYPMIYGKLMNWEAIQKFFGLTESQAKKLFDIGDYGYVNPSPEIVSRRIKEMVESN